MEKIICSSSPASRTDASPSDAIVPTPSSWSRPVEIESEILRENIVLSSPKQA